MSMTDRLPTVYRYDSNGVAVPEEQELDELSTLDHPVARALMSGRVPQYIQELIKKHPDQPDAVIHEYDLFAGVSSADFLDFLNTDVTIQGAMMLPHGPYTGQDGEHHDGYWKCYLMLTDQDPKSKSNIVIGCSGQNIVMWTALALATKGWGIWPKPVKVFLSGNKDQGYRIRTVDRPVPNTRASEHKA